IPRGPPPTSVGRGPVSASRGTPEFMPEKIPGVWGQSPQDSALPPSAVTSLACLPLPGLHRLPEAVAFPIHLQDVTPVCQSVHQRRCHPLPLEDLPPLAERQVARHQQTPPLVPLREHLEQQLGPRTAEPHAAHLA